MKILLLLLTLFLFFSCNQKKQKENSTEKEHLEKTTVIEVKKVPEITFPISPIDLNPRYTWEENINATWNQYLGGAPDEIYKIFELSEFKKEEGVFIVVTKDGTTNYFTLLPQEDGTYVLDKINTSSISVLHQYGNAATITIKPYEISIDFNDKNGLVVSYEIFGMKEVPNGDGMMPFQKIQHDYLTFNEQGNLEYNIGETEKFNDRFGVDMKEHSSLDTHEFLYQKYFTTIDRAFNPHLFNLLMSDMDIYTTRFDDRDNIFGLVRKQDNGEYVNDNAFAELEAFFVSQSNDLNLEHIDYSDYPIFYVEDHGSYFYRIDHVKVDDKEIALDLERVLYIDENSGELDRTSDITYYIVLMNIEGKWLLINNSDRLMMEKDRLKLQTIDSNEGE
ncbi:hypothetical protein [Flammeovirga aprica]|uniref:Lipoprotein n=1 Tax=Flammeovirga aprica JL-4 TaxID=694437 RepID=A0A7X9RY82_9BACT|nr:hypothetical protein [Flammeovirga aprica]NME70865.1 hypothetical protein [Flammeovirga aprica JL-4]